MEQIILGIVDHQEYDCNFKKQCVNKILSNVATSSLGHADRLRLFRFLLDWILNSDVPMWVEMGHKHFKILAKANSAAFFEFIHPNIIIDIFTNPTYSNKLEIVKFIEELMHLLHCVEPEEHLEKRRTITNIMKSYLFAYLKNNGAQLEIAAEISLIYQLYPSILPPQSDWVKFSVEIVHLLSQYRKVGGDKTFSQKTEEVSLMLPLIWGRSESVDGIQECLKLFYVIISTEDSLSKPSCAMLRIIDKIPKAYLEVATKSIMDESGQTHGEAKTVLGLINMIGWLTQEQCNRDTSNWIQEILLGLRERERNSILIEIAHSATEVLMSSLTNNELNDTVEPIFFFLLMGFQHSESVFHSLVSHVPNILIQLSKDPKTKMLLQRLGEAVYFLTIRFPDYPELYNPVLQVLEELKIDTPSDERVSDLKTLSWLSPNYTSSLLSNSLLKKKCSFVDEALAFRSETGMIGLLNLGNTCYMNSVLQALFITTEFCNGVLFASLHNSQSVLLRLQKAFTFLRYSQRSIYSPAELLKIARPPWFEDGRQQDCSEFLRYLLDTLHEQERSGRGKGACTYGEHKIIRSNSSSKELSNSKDSTLHLQEESGKLKKSSNLALDVISEAPENGKLDEDDHMSQDGGKRLDEDYFGSRGSLFHSRQDASEDEGEEDFRGSRTSLGSFSGLKRWTTEGNLSSYDGSREGKMNLLDGPLNDSHSNSTDSGIQSVGDSIRGSSDSVTNAQPNDLAAQSNVFTIANDSTPMASKSAPFVSLVQEIFGGKMMTSYECTNCHSLSMHREYFTDFNLAIPEFGKVKEVLTVQNLLENYLKPEALEQENKYHCVKCSGLQDAVKCVKVLEGPEHLMCTLMRFKYDRRLSRKSKVFTDIDYKLTLELPTYPDENDVQDVTMVQYALYAIVVHSGYSSDGGHYYTYAREPKNYGRDVEGQEDMECSDSEEEPWFIFNDSKVSFATFDSFKSVTKKFPRDTAYLLFYRKQNSMKESVGKRPLRSDLKTSVEKDNLLFMREKEKLKRKSVPSPLQNAPQKQKFDNDDDDSNGYGNSGGSFNTPGRLVF